MFAGVSHRETCDWWMVLKVWVEARDRFFPLELASSKHSQINCRVTTNCHFEKAYKSNISGKNIS